MTVAGAGVAAFGAGVAVILVRRGKRKKAEKKEE
jgi:hypothetical protein